MISRTYKLWVLVLIMVKVHNARGAFLHGPQEMLPHPFHMTYDPVHIMPGVTRDFALRCERDLLSPVRHVLKKVSMMRILKKVGFDEWQLTAELTEGEGPVAFKRHVTTSGRLNPVSVNTNFLEVRWPLVDEDTLGVYRCDVVGKNEDNNSDEEMTTEVELTKIDISQDALISLLLQTRYDIEKLIENNSRDITFLQDKNGNSQSGCLSRSTAIAWPGGKYALLKPDTGCPVDLAFYGGNSGYVRLHTESTEHENNNTVHNETHLSQPVIAQFGSKVFFYLRFCVVTKVFNNAPWPHGSYCIHPKDDQCPYGFSLGTIHLDTEDHQNADIYGGNAPFKRPAHLPFCCRNDNSFHVPITLPTESPFYLYRKGGECQQVEDMRVREEFMEIDTENFLNQNGVIGIVPDSHLSPESIVRIELCYYSKK